VAILGEQVTQIAEFGFPADGFLEETRIGIRRRLVGVSRRLQPSKEIGVQNWGVRGADVCEAGAQGSADEVFDLKDLKRGKVRRRMRPSWSTI